MTIREQLAVASAAEFITVEEFALLARYHPITVYRKIARGDIQGVRRFGVSIRINKRVALGWVLKNREIDLPQRVRA